jgi:hypothetical protein
LVEIESEFKGKKGYGYGEDRSLITASALEKGQYSIKGKRERGRYGI